MGRSVELRCGRATLDAKFAPLTVAELGHNVCIAAEIADREAAASVRYDHAPVLTVSTCGKTEKSK
jgi:hypothetical protein